jgi:hypothetical protein
MNTVYFSEIFNNNIKGGELQPNYTYIVIILAFLVIFYLFNYNYVVESNQHKDILQK